MSKLLLQPLMLLERKSDVDPERVITVDTGQRTFGFCEDINPDTKIYRIKPNLYISSQDGASNYTELMDHQITHILNVATGVKNAYPEEFIYRKIELLDIPETRIDQHFSEMIDFINTGCRDGAVLVHCNAGISRSSTAVIAYLMHSMRMTLSDALELVREARPVAKPNDGFMKQLQEYEQKLRL
ncbi:Dual specificity protein phosphatase 19 [Exaiptasia diaphana]|nr:Dual specificity protein phosphatase 19 [Exaiptasia diaphana]